MSSSLLQYIYLHRQIVSTYVAVIRVTIGKQQSAR